MTLATGVGSLPGDDDRDYAEAVKLVFGELGEGGGLPYLPELPARGAGAGMTGRALAIMDGIGADLQPAGWRLTDAPGIDHRRARSQLAQDLDQIEEQGQGLTGGFKVQVAGPWTLAATVERPRGDKVLADHGARRDLAQALAEGVRGHVADVRRRLTGVERLVVQVDEPSLTAVLGAGIPTASGFGRHRAVHPPEASEALGWLLDAITESGAEPWVHTCAGEAPLQLLRGAGARGLSVDLGMLSAADHEVVAEALDAGESVALGIVPSTDPGEALADGELAERVLRWLDMVGLDPATVGGQLLLTTTCGLAGASPYWVRESTSLLRAAAAHLT